MKNLITLLLVLVTLNGFSQVSAETFQRIKDSVRNAVANSHRDYSQKLPWKRVHVPDTVYSDKDFWRLGEVDEYKLSKLAFHYLNVWREFNDLEKMIWSDKLYKVALHHSQYQNMVGEVTHWETRPLKGHKKVLRTSKDRYEYYSKGEGYLGENAGAFFFFNSYERAAKNMIEGWITSPGHNKLLLESNEWAGGHSDVYGAIAVSGKYKTLNSYGDWEKNK